MQIKWADNIVEQTGLPFCAENVIYLDHDFKFLLLLERGLASV